MHSQWIQDMRARPAPRIGWRPIVVIAVAVGLLVVAVALGAARSGRAGDGETSGGAYPVIAVRSGGTTPEELAASKGGTAGVASAALGAAQTSDAAGASNAVSAGAPDLPTLDAGRTIIRSGKVDLAVRSVADAFGQVSQVATAAGGYVSDSTFTGAADHPTAYLTIRVPEARFGEVVTQLRGLAVEVRAVSTSANDVTDQYTDVEATLANLRAVEAQYVQLLGRTGSIGEVLQVQDRLNQVRLQIDRTEARRRVLESQSALSTIAVTLQPVDATTAAAKPATGPLAAARDAWQASLRTLEGIATAVLVVLVYAWWIAPFAVAGAVIARRRMRRRAPVAGGPDGA